MIYEGKNGSINLFWKDTFISSLPLGGKTKNYNKYKTEAHRFLMYSLESENIKELIHHYNQCCNNIYWMKTNNKKICCEKHMLFQYSLLALIRLNLIDEDDVLLIMNKKKNKSLSRD